MEVKYKSWNDINIKTYNRLKNIKLDNGDNINLINYNIQLLSVLTGANEEDIENLPINEFNALIKATDFLREEIKTVRTKFIYKINDKEYFFQTNPRLLTTGQFIDFQTYIKNESSIEHILSCCLIPYNKKYGDYDIEEAIKDIAEHLSIVDALSIQFFFCSIIRKVKDSFPNFFNNTDEEIEEEEQEQGDTNDVGNSNEFASKWNWIILIDNISELTRESWDKVFEKPIIEFINLCCYLKDKREYEKQQIDSFQKGTVKHY